MPELRLSPSGQLMRDARDHLIEYLKEHPEPISPATLVRILNKQDKIPTSSLKYGDTSYYFMIRQEAYKAMISSLICSAKILVGPKWKVCWYEHVPKEERHVWRGGEWD